MSKQDIDNYITVNYKSLIQYADAMIKAKKLDETPEFIVSETYLYLLKHKDVITSETIKNYSSTFIYKNTSWVNSQVRELGSKLKNPPTTEFIDELYDTIDDEIDSIVDDELNMTDYQTIIEIYRQSLTSPYKIRVAQAYFDGKNYTVRKFANHFGFSTTPAMKIIRELKEDIINFKNKLEKNK